MPNRSIRAVVSGGAALAVAAESLRGTAGLPVGAYVRLPLLAAVIPAALAVRGAAQRTAADLESGWSEREMVPPNCQEGGTDGLYREWKWKLSRRRTNGLDSKFPKLREEEEFPLPVVATSSTFLQ